MPKQIFESNLLLSGLSGVCRDNPRTKKILIVPSYQVGHQMLEGVARAGTAWINFHVATIFSLAMELAEEVLVSRSLQVLPQSGVQALIDSILNNLFDSNELRYFEKHPVNKGIVEALAKTVSELRLCGVSQKDIKEGALLNRLKEKDIRLLLSRYEKTIEEMGFVDEAGLIAIALDSAGKDISGDRPAYYIPSSYCVSGIKRRLLEQLCGDSLIILKEDPVYGLERPKGSLAFGEKEPDKSPAADRDIERLKWLFAPADAPPALKDGTVEIFSALGYRNEVREAFRRIISGGLSSDSVEIVYTDRRSYGELIYSLCEKLGVPATFSEGVPAHITGAGRALAGFLLWARDDFGEKRLRHIIASGGLKLPPADYGDVPGSSSLAYLLRTSGIGWGRERYSFVLSKKIDEIKSGACKMREEGEDDLALYQERLAGDLGVLKKVCQDLIGLIPEKDSSGKIDFGKLCLGCMEFLDKHVRLDGETEAAFVSGAKSRLEIIANMAENRVVLEDALNKLINSVSEMSIMVSGPKPGHLQVSGIKSGGRSGRSNVFMVGFDEGKFPAKFFQDPVLLDEERKNISSDLELSGERMAKSIYEAAGLVSGLRGRLTVSFSAFDIRENRRSFPSSFILQAFRIKEGRPEADYNDLFRALGEPAGFSGSVELDETGWWIKNMAQEGILKDGLKAVTQHYKGLRAGLAAEKKRSSDIFTEYDGKVSSAGEELDPRLNRAMVMSCSRLETAARCPFAYFLENILGVRKPEETEKEIFAWLDAMEKGSLLHDVFQKFVDEARGKKKPGDRELSESIERILGEVVLKYKDDIPPPSEVVFLSEYTQLKRDVGVFLKVISGLETEPVECEASFGDKPENAVLIDLGSGGILLRGKIDRIDKAGPSQYHVWDYKTGSAYMFRGKVYVLKGRQVQHCLYAAAAEQLLRKRGGDKNARVVKSGYILTTEKGTREGRGSIFERPVDRKDVWQLALNKVLDLVGRGNFMATTDDSCLFCDYADICGGEDARSRMQFKVANSANAELQAWSELNEIK